MFSPFLVCSLVAFCSAPLLAPPTTPGHGADDPPGVAWGSTLAPMNNLWSGAFGMGGGHDGSLVVAGMFQGTLELAGTKLVQVGQFENMLVAKYDPSGQVLWARQATATPTSGYTRGRDAAIDRAGFVYVCGEYAHEINFGNGVSLQAGHNAYGRAFVVKYSPDGEPLWARDGKGIEDWPNNTKPTIPASISVDAKGGVYFAGSFFDNATFGPHELAGGGKEVVLVKYEGQSGEIVWILTAGGAGFERCLNADLDEKESIYLFLQGKEAMAVGNVEVPSDPTFAQETVIAKIDRNTGEVLWAKRGLGNCPDQHVGWGAASPDGGAVICGRLRLSINISPATFAGKKYTTNQASEDSVVYKLDADGAVKWVRVFGGAQHERARRLAVDRNGDVFVAGWMTGSGDYGGTTLSSYGGRDMYLAKFAGMNGQWLWAMSAGGSGADNANGLVMNRNGFPAFAGTCQSGAFHVGDYELEGSSTSNLMLIQLGENAGGGQQVGD